ncbi:vWA domain-containing protein [Virgisporangium aurantiacum]|uniref:VWFA domain-containing protein n=1 Tax=Virgisporangium aurantiacum TaxID=175570 RepID=A0A8J4E9E3_9ACTN|nr:VWA domain-containing protein [Virgisporangium aurantiacum]GIJ63642.1 hypothetical protein Vau01_111580 [Virgisporangium aurantiacum]
MDIVKIALHPERPVVRKDAVSETDLVVEVSCERKDHQARRAGPVNLCLVVDRSGSMSGGKLDTAKKSCVDIFRRLDKGDLLTVVAFDDQADVIVNPQTPADEVEARLNAIVTGGMTNLSLGWYQGLLELQTHMNESHHSRLFLLSDGQANYGETKRAVFADTGSRARDVGISASTVGIGADFQEDLLEAIASSSGGRFWNIGESDIEDIIEEEFEGALTVLIDRPRVALTLPDGVRVSRELNKIRQVGRRYRLRPLQGEDTFNFAVRLEVDPEQVTADRVAIGANLFDGDREIASTELELTVGTRQEVAASPSHPLVRSIVQQFETESTDERVLSDLESGNVTALRQMLTVEIAKLKQIESDGAGLDASAWNLSTARWQGEMSNIGQHVSVMSVIDWCVEMIEPYRAEPEVQAFFGSMRKTMMQETHRNAARHLGVTDWDDAAPIILEALALADQLIDRHPDDAARIERIREKLREYLDHN